MTYRIRNIALAVALALVAALLTTFYVANYKRHVQQGEQNVQVYVAARDIPAGLTGAQVVHRHLLRPEQVARRTVVPGAISSTDQIERLTARQQIFSGEQVSLRRFGSDVQTGMRAHLAGTLRAVEIPGDANQLLVGILKTGDRVDVVANVPQQSDHVTRIVLRNLLVLEAPDPSTLGQRTATTAAAFSAVLAVRDTQVQRLFFAMKNADWTLELRPTGDAADSPDVAVDTESIVNAGTRSHR